MKNILLTVTFFCSLVSLSITAHTVYVYAPGWDINLYFNAVGVTKELEDLVTFKQINHPAQLPNNEHIIVFDLENNEHLYRSLCKEKAILFLWEPPSVKPHNYYQHLHRYFSRVYTWHDELVDSNNKTYFKFYYPVKHDPISNVPAFKDKKLCGMVVSNKNSPHANQLYTERQALVNFFNFFHPNDFDLYGYDWPNSLPIYRGTVNDKVACQSQYKFCVAYENIQNEPGYITEKIFDCFTSGTIPIYWGADNITNYIPETCFINRRNFASNGELYEFLTTLNERDYINYNKNIQEFLKSPQAHLFSNDHFIELIKNLCTELLESK